MIVTENHCCDCAAPGYPCRGLLCPNRHVEVHYCDRCGPPFYGTHINKDTGEELCDDCFEENETEESKC